MSDTLLFNMCLRALELRGNPVVRTPFEMLAPCPSMDMLADPARLRTLMIFTCTSAYLSLA